VSKIEDDFNLKLHLEKWHNLELVEVVQCDLCPLKVLSEKDLTAHKEAEHPHLCSKCYLCEKVGDFLPIVKINVPTNLFSFQKVLDTVTVCILTLFQLFCHF
jgi:hypothetical protein